MPDMEMIDMISKASQEVDFDNVQDAIGYATLIFAAAKEYGLLLDNAKQQSREGIRITQMAKEWVGNINSQISTRMSAGDTMELLEPYDFMHRIGLHSPIPQHFYDEYLMKAFEACVHGDKTVNEYYLFRLIRLELDKKSKPYFGRPLDWYSASLDCWHKQFKYGKATGDLSDYKTLEIVSILLSENLFVFEGSKQGEFKKILFENHRHYLDEIEDLDFEELGALSRFVSSASKYLQPAQYPEYTKAITAAQIAHPETNRFYRINLQHFIGIFDV